MRLKCELEMIFILRYLFSEFARIGKNIPSSNRIFPRRDFAHFVPVFPLNREPYFRVCQVREHGRAIYQGHRGLNGFASLRSSRPWSRGFLGPRDPSPEISQVRAPRLRLGSRQAEVRLSQGLRGIWDRESSRLFGTWTSLDLRDSGTATVSTI